MKEFLLTVLVMLVFTSGLAGLGLGIISIVTKTNVELGTVSLIVSGAFILAVFYLVDQKSEKK